MDKQYKDTFDKNAATRTKYNIEDVENNVAHRQWVTKNNRSNWAQIESPDSNRAVFDGAVTQEAGVVAKEESQEAANEAAILKS